MNRRQFLTLIPAAAVAGTVSAAVPKSLSLEEGLLSAWRVAPVALTAEGVPLLSLRMTKCRKVVVKSEGLCPFTGREGCLNTFSFIIEDDKVSEHLSQVNPHLEACYHRVPYWWIETEQGPMRLCPHSLRWFPYSPKEAI